MFVETFARLKNWLSPPKPVILNFVEEIEVRNAAYDKLKDFIVKRTGTKPSTHFIHIAASREACPVLDPYRCGYQPADLRYAPCPRQVNHDGPCAHDFRLSVFQGDQ